MYKYDLAVYGHITVDRIINNFEEEVSLGAIANFWNALNIINSKIRYKLCPCAIGEAVVLINECKSQRVGRGNLNLKTSKPKPIDAKWHHVMYLNQLKDKSFLKDLTGIVSADLTAGAMDIKDDLKHVDYLFISEEDLFMDIKDLAQLVKRNVILHYPSGSICVGKNKSKTYTTTFKENMNVLGAGDSFAACFISNMLTHDNLDISIQKAHEMTLEVLTYEN